MKPYRPRYLNRPVRTDIGIVTPQFVIHSALAHLPRAFGTGAYGKSTQEERLFDNLAYAQVESCLHALQERPPSVSLQFPVESAQLPMITVVRESMVTSEQYLGDFAGSVPDEVNYTETETVLTPAGGAAGGETEFYLPSVGDIIGSTVDVSVRRGDDLIPLFQDAGEYSVDPRTKLVTLDPAMALIAGDELVVTRYASYGYPGGHAQGAVFLYTGSVFIDTENPILTAFLEGLVWRELILSDDLLFGSGIAELEMDFRDLSPWDEIHPAIGYRAEIITRAITEWGAYSRTNVGTENEPRTMDAEIYSESGSVDADGNVTEGSTPILQLSFDLVAWDDPSNCGG